MNQRFKKPGTPIKKKPFYSSTITPMDIINIKRQIYEEVRAEILESMSTLFLAAFAISIQRKFPKWGTGAVLEMMNGIDKIIGEMNDMTIDEMVEFCADETGVRIQQEDVWAEKVAEAQRRHREKQ